MKRILSILLCAVFLCGCTLPEKIDKDTVLGELSLATESRLPIEEETDEDFQEETQEIPQIQEMSEMTVAKEIRTAEDFQEDVKAEMMRKQQDLYCFSMLEITQQNLYVEILYALENYVEEMEISTTETAQIDKVVQCVLMDHPEIFYTDGYSFVKYTFDGEIQKITFKGTYIYDPEEKAQREARIEAEAERILEGISEDASDYEKVKYVYETIIEQTGYDVEAADNQNICSVFLGHASVCQGYAKAVQYLLNKMQIPCTLVIGTVENGEGHAWNLVRIHNRYYYLDATWGDASYLVHLNEDGQEVWDMPAINYDYLCVTTEEIEKTHSISPLVPLPVCDSLEANYYVQEGAYFQEVDLSQLEQLTERYRKEGRESVTLRCATDSVYQQMEEELLTKQKIFWFIGEDSNSILYTASPVQKSITFWL